MLLIWVSPDSALAREPGPEDMVREKLQRKVTFSFKNTPLSKAVSTLRKMTGVKMTIDPSVTKVAKGTPITMRVDGWPLGFALRMTLKLADLDYTVTPDGIVILPSKGTVDVGDLPLPDGLPGVENKVGDSGAMDIIRGELARKVNIDFVDTPLGDAINIVGLRVQVTMLLEPGIWERGLLDGSVNMKIRDMRGSEVLKEILEPAGLDYRIRPQSEALQIFDPKKNEKPPVREGFRNRMKKKTAYEKDCAARSSKMRSIRSALYSVTQLSRRSPGSFPSRMSALYPDRLRRLDAFVLPNRRPPLAAAQIDEKTSYGLVSGLTLESRHDAALAYEKTPDARGKVLVLFLDGHMEWIPARRLQKLLKESSASGNSHSAKTK